MVSSDFFAIFLTVILKKCAHTFIHDWNLVHGAFEIRLFTSTRCEGRGRGGGVKGDTVAHRLKVLKTPAPNASRDPLRFRTICAEMKHATDNTRYFMNWRAQLHTLIIV